MTNDDYEVGYAKPPRHAQWRKGQSGNPKGRPKKNVAELVNALLNERIVVRKGRTTQRMTRLEHLVRGLIEKAAEGDPRLLRMALDEARRDDVRAGEGALEPVDHEVIAALLQRLRKT